MLNICFERRAWIIQEEERNFIRGKAILGGRNGNMISKEEEKPFQNDGVPCTLLLKAYKSRELWLLFSQVVFAFSALF